MEKENEQLKRYECQHCNKLLAVGKIMDGKVEIKCPRCKEVNCICEKK